jgi:FtsP/CotA-like multicopper oxidase with cupredoxin domain
MKISRRRFIILSSLGLASASLVSLPQLVKSIRARTGGTFSQPPELKNQSSQLGQVEFDLTASASRVRLPGQNGVEAGLMTYNGSFPGPTMRVQEGDRVRIRFRNNLDQPTNLHFHGLHIPPTGLADNPFRMVEPGEVAVYEFSIPKGTVGTNWYHPHHHGNSNQQVFAGLSGALIVGGSLDAIPELQSVPDYLLVLKDLTLDGQGNIPPLTSMEWMNGREGSLLMINGMVNPTLSTDAGMARLRLINQSPGRYYNLKLIQQPMTVIATDGRFVATPYRVESLLMAPGERYEVLVEAQQPAELAIVNLPYDRGRMDMRMMGSGGMQGMSGMHNMPGMGNRETQAAGPLMTLVFTGNQPAAKMPVNLNTIKTLSPSDAVHRRTLNFTEQMGRMSTGMTGMSSGQGMMSFSFNGQKFDMNRIDIQVKLGTVELWELINTTDMDHPFHLHVNAFQVYARNGKPETHTVWKDVVNVRSKETVQILIPFTDFSGKTVFHCHILEHEELGMMGVVEIVA